MTTTRQRFSAEEIVKILRLHLVQKEPVSDISERYGLKPNTFYRWQKQFFDNGAAAFITKPNSRKDSKLERKITQLKEKLTNKDEVIAEIMADHVRLKKSLGED